MQTNLNCSGNNYHLQACSTQYIHHCKLDTLNKCRVERFNSTQLSGWNKMFSEIFFSNQLYQFQQCGQGGSLCPLLVYFVLKISRFPRTIWPACYIKFPGLTWLLLQSNTWIGFCILPGTIQVEIIFFLICEMVK